MSQASVITAPARKNFIARHRRQLLIGGPIVAVIVAAVFYINGGRYVSTDDAYVQAARVQISTNVSGRIVEIDVHDNQTVHAGDILFKLDERPLQIAVEDAQARLAAAKLRVEALKATYLQRTADEKLAQNTLAYQQREFDRQKMLQADGISSRAQLDLAEHGLQTARQQVAASGQQTATAIANLGGRPDDPVENHPDVQQAQAALDRANLNFSYTVIRAPIDGIVTKVEQVQVGDYVTAATPEFALVSQKDLWVEANFKETDLTHMRPGQPATFSVDAYPGKHFTGKVQSTSPGTGSSFSLLPPENSSGNWVKVVQRLPVRLSIETKPSDAPLAAGMSVLTEVDTGYRRSIYFWRNQ